MTRRTLMDRAREAGERFADAHHGKPRVIDGKRYQTPLHWQATLAHSAGWLAGYRAAKREKRR